MGSENDKAEGIDWPRAHASLLRTFRREIDERDGKLRRAHEAWRRFREEMDELFPEESDDD